VRRLLYSLAVLALLLPSRVWSQPLVPADRLGGLLATIAQAKDPAFGSAVAPALSLDTHASRGDRAAQIVARIAHEVEAVTSAFAAAPDAERIARTKAAVAAFSPETARDGAARSFEGNGPALSVMRQVLFVPVKSAGAGPAAKIMTIISRFERSPKTDDTYYEYSDAAELKLSQVTELPGSAASWTTQARPPMTPDKVYALKKCRHVMVLGWYCNTQLYAVRDLPGSGGAVKLLLTFLRPLAKGADNARFSGDRAKNIVDGYTAVYVVAASGDMVLVYNLGIQSSADAPSQQGLLNRGHKEEYAQLKSRIAAVLGLASLPF